MFVGRRLGEVSEDCCRLAYDWLGFRQTGRRDDRGSLHRGTEFEEDEAWQRERLC